MLAACAFIRIYNNASFSLYFVFLGSTWIVQYGFIAVKTYRQKTSLKDSTVIKVLLQVG